MKAWVIAFVPFCGQKFFQMNACTTLIWKSTMKQIALTLLLAVFLLGDRARAQITEGDDGPPRLGRFEVDGKIGFGVLSVGGVHELNMDYFNPNSRFTGEVILLEKIRLLAPVEPGKIVFVENNLAGRAKKTTENLKVSVRENVTVLAPDSEIVIDDKNSNLLASGQLVIVISDRLSKVSAKDAEQFIAGVTIGWHLKGNGNSEDADQVALGPWLTLGLSHNRLKLEMRVNGKTKTRFALRKMNYRVEQIIAAVSQTTGLLPGDVVFTGFPVAPVALNRGDKIEVLLEGVGRLKISIAR
jgi:2-keto-4-pentenoate hydratase/2-oxohepta-3-ene-1,7-dioic acid hydratase in catechol pathway